MRILKYIFLLLLLSLVALTIFIATQKGDYTIERSKIINSPKSAVFNYVNDYRNWGDFISWTIEDPEAKINYSENTIGKGASFSWEGKESNGEMRTLSVKENEDISQKMDSEGTTSSINWTFKDTLGGTKVTWKAKGKMSFFLKVYTALNGGADKVIGTIYEKTLINLDKALVYEINTFSIKENGIVTKPLSFYLCQTFTSEIAKINKNFKIVIPKITDFCKDNNIAIAGKPFILYHTYDTQKGLAKISIGVPIQSEIFITAGSDIESGKLEAFEAVKTTLSGDYSHLKKALNKSVDYLQKNQITRNPLFSHLEIYTNGKDDTKKPSEWLTEIFVPIIPKIIPIKTENQGVPSYNEINEDPTTTDPNAVEAVKKTKPVQKSSEPKKAATPKIKEEGQSEF